MLQTVSIMSQDLLLIFINNFFIVVFNTFLHQALIIYVCYVSCVVYIFLASCGNSRCCILEDYAVTPCFFVLSIIIKRCLYFYFWKLVRVSYF
ncbi:hypothetical protein HanIR_Chr15g0741431 [Helianthus annuus]|nr:hypothetical protein HanIR_Chr15g0741431 [Helianthus annuus]